MTKPSFALKIKATAIAVLTGFYTFQAGSCTSQSVKTQLANGLRTGLTGVFNITSGDIANEIFDVDD
ncbi:MAG: hypothetical protein ACE5GE_00130 [Phycisphaerae bacterium]